MADVSWLKQYRKELDSAVFQSKDPYIQKVWDWCKMRANFVAGQFEGIAIRPGEFVSGRDSGARFCKMSPSSFWRKLKKLESWGNIVLKSDSRFTVITLCNWQTYNGEENLSGQKVDSERTASGQRADTSIEGKKERRKEITQGAGKPPVFVKPSLDQIEEYCRERGNEVDPQTWIDHYTSNGWMVGKNRMRDWKAAVRTWEKNNFHAGNGKSEPDLPLLPKIKYVDLTPEEKASEKAEAEAARKAKNATPH